MTKTIVLVGMMGSGKSSIGKELAKKTGLHFIDTDIEIENIKKLKVFSQLKVRFFRKLEEKICKKFINGRKNRINWWWCIYE